MTIFPRSYLEPDVAWWVVLHNILGTEATHTLSLSAEYMRRGGGLSHETKGSWVSASPCGGQPAAHQEHLLSLLDELQMYCYFVWATVHIEINFSLQPDPVQQHNPWHVAGAMWMWVPFPSVMLIVSSVTFSFTPVTYEAVSWTLGLHAVIPQNSSAKYILSLTFYNVNESAILRGEVPQTRVTQLISGRATSWTSLSNPMPGSFLVSHTVFLSWHWGQMERDGRKIPHGYEYSARRF